MRSILTDNPHSSYVRLVTSSRDLNRGLSASIAWRVVPASTTTATTPKGKSLMRSPQALVPVSPTVPHCEDYLCSKRVYILNTRAFIPQLKHVGFPARHLIILTLIVIGLLATSLSGEQNDSVSISLTIADLTTTTTTLITTTTVGGGGGGGGGAAPEAEKNFIFDLRVTDKIYSVNSLIFKLIVGNRGEKSGDIKVRYDIVHVTPILTEFEQLWVNATDDCATAECPLSVSLTLPDMCKKPATLNVTLSDVEEPNKVYAGITEDICIELRECLTDKDCPTGETCVDNKCYHKPTSTLERVLKYAPILASLVLFVLFVPIYKKTYLKKV